MQVRALLLLTLVLFSSRAHAVLYWDVNGSSPGGSDGATASGDWSASFWTTDPDGNLATAAWVDGETAVFSAGTNVAGTSTITGNATVGGLVIEEGTVVISGTITAGASPITVNAGAVLETNSSLRISTSAGSVYTLNGGTLRTTNPGANGSFVDVDSTIVLNGGGTIDYQVPNTLNIIQTNTIISGTGPLIKTGVGVLAIASPSTHTGGTIINDGELRIRTSNNRLPTGQGVTINSPGILNLNGVSQQVSSITGDGRIGLANARLTVNTGTFNGTIEDTANAGAGGSTSTGGIVQKNGTGTLTLTGANTFTGGLTHNNGRINYNNNSAAGTGVITVTASADVFASTAPGIEIPNNIALATSEGTLGGLEILATQGNSLKQTGQISGPGKLVRTNNGAGIVTLAGNNTFTGGVQITSRGLVLGHSNALGTGTLTIGDANPPANPITLAAESDLTVLGPVINDVVLNQSFTVTGDHSFELAGPISGSGGLTKSGASTVVLSSSASSYTGDTAVQAGTLRLGNPLLSDNADVLLTTGGLLELNFFNTDTIRSLFIDGLAQATGSWGALGNLSADHQSPLIIGPGLLQVTTQPIGLSGDYNSDGKVDAADYVLWRKDPAAHGGNPAGYDAWRASFGATSGSGANAISSAVPEPAAAFLLLLALAVGLLCRIRPHTA